MDERFGTETEAVQAHYRAERLVETIGEALAAQGTRRDRLRPADLAPVDEFHLRGREATLELAERSSWPADLEVLDLGCGLGGSSRFLAAELGCSVTGVDLTDAYVEAARTLADWVGLGDAVRFRQADACALPFADASFDRVWTQHVQMNVPGKERFYAEAARVLRPGGQLLFHDIFQGPGGPLHYPVPWAGEAAISHLWEVPRLERCLAETGLVVEDWEDRTAASTAWLEERSSAAGPPPLGIHLLMGARAPEKLRNLARNLAEGRVAVIQAVLRRPREI